MRTTISIEEALLKKAKAEAASRGITLSDVIDEALRERLLRQQQARSQTRQRPFKLISVRGPGLVKPDLDLTSNAAVQAYLDEVEDKPTW
jgi:hypothetical protein